MKIRELKNTARFIEVCMDFLEKGNFSSVSGGPFDYRSVCSAILDAEFIEYASKRRFGVFIVDFSISPGWLAEHTWLFPFGKPGVGNSNNSIMVQLSTQNGNSCFYFSCGSSADECIVPPLAKDFPVPKHEYGKKDILSIEDFSTWLFSRGEARQFQPIFIVE
jgi:hypothetical protein